MATSEWEYAVLSGNVYVDDWKKRGVPQPDAGDAPAATPEAYERRGTPDSSGPLPLPGWTRWDDFPSGDVRRQAREVGLFVEVWEKASPPIVAVAFRGTEFTSVEDWISNLRWFLRFVPFYPDQYGGGPPRRPRG